MLCFVVVMQSFIMNSHEVFIHIHQGCFAGTGAIVWLPQCQWSEPDGYMKISQCIITTKHSKAKTVCIFLGIYCILSHWFYWIMCIILIGWRTLILYKLIWLAGAQFCFVFIIRIGWSKVSASFSLAGANWFGMHQSEWLMPSLLILCWYVLYIYIA